jgi:hypothetical protein
MQVRDLIKELERFEPTSEVRVNVQTSGTYSGVPWTNEAPGTIETFEIEKGEPVLFCKCS